MPAISPREIELVRDSFVDILFAPDQAATIFYGRLFALAPETRRLFKNDLGDQGRVLIATLAKVVAGLSNIEDMLPTLRELALRHVGYGAERRHYDIVGAAMIEMVVAVSRSGIDAATRDAWVEAYTLIAGAMTSAAYGPPDA